jgi:hypothetical protein
MVIPAKLDNLGAKSNSYILNQVKTIQWRSAYVGVLTNIPALVKFVGKTPTKARKVSEKKIHKKLKVES